MLELWFVNVGHGDSTIVRFPSGRVMMVDINNCQALDGKSVDELCKSKGIDPMRYLLSAALGGTERMALKDYEDMLEDPLDVLKRECPGSAVFRFVASHPDMDHLTGLYRLSRQESTNDIVNFWDTANTKSEPEELGPGQDGRDWEEYQRLRRSGTDPKAHFKVREDRGNYWTDDGISILAPTPKIIEDANQSGNWNHISQVLHIQYGDSSVILPGDTSIAVQEELAQIYGESLGSSILKAPHHGRDSGYCNEFAKLVHPDYTIVSVGKKPDTDASNKYRQHSRKVYSTRFQGTIHAQLWEDGSVRMYNHVGRRIDIGADVERFTEILARNMTSQ